MIILFPSMYNDAARVDEDFEAEKKIVDSLGIKSYLFNYDAFVYDKRPFRVNVLKSDITATDMNDIVVYRGPSVSSECYQKMHSGLNKLGLKLINARDEYRLAHEFYYAYKQLRGYTPNMLCYSVDDTINWKSVKSVYTKFRLSDYVKTIKGFNFPDYFDSTYSNVELDGYLNRFKELRGELLTGGLLIKDYAELKRDSDGNSNEYRCWYCGKNLIYHYRYTKYNNGNSLDMNWLRTVPKLKSNFYSLDVAELKSGGWIVLGTDDGQVSELSNQNSENVLFIKNFYKSLRKGCLNNVK